MASSASSKYRHIVAAPAKRELWYEGLSNAQATTSDGSTGIAASAKFIAYASSAIGNTLSVISVAAPGKTAGSDALTFTGHSGKLSDIAFAPWDDYLVATSSIEKYVNLWTIPKVAGEKVSDVPLAKLDGHEGVVNCIRFHPSASNVLATSSKKNVYTWDASTSDKPVASFGGPEVYADVIYDIAWSYDGKLVATTSKDCKLRLVDGRSGTLVSETGGHEGLKPSRVVWAGNTPYFLTSGFSKSRDREVGLWDPRALAAPVSMSKIDNGTSVNIPFYDDDVNLLYLMGKGDTAIRYYELVSGDLQKLNATRDTTQQNGGAMLPKRALDASDCEVGRFLRLTATGIQPLSFSVPRKDKARVFQSDLYPDTAAAEPSISAASWIKGEDALPKLIAVSAAPVVVLGSGAASTLPKAAVPAPLRPASVKSVGLPESTSPLASPSSAAAAVWNKSVSGDLVGGRPSSRVIEAPLDPEVIRLKEIEKAKADAARRSAKFGDWMGEKLKFKHAKGEGTKKEKAWFNATPQIGGATDSFGIAVSATHFAIPYKGAGGAVLVHPLSEPRKLVPGESLLRGHTCDVLDVAFSPFDNTLLFTADDLGYIKSWKVPESRLTADIGPADAKGTMAGHASACRQVVPHPTADGVLMSGAMDNTVRIWDVETSKERSCFRDLWTEMFYNLSFKGDGTSAAVIARDKKLRVFDPRSGVVAAFADAHEGAKTQQVVWCGESNYLLTVGSDSRSMREIFLWDVRNLAGGKISRDAFGAGSGALLPLFDADTNVLFVASKGDLSVKLFEVHSTGLEAGEGASVHHSSDWTASPMQCEAIPLLGFAMLPKRTCNVAKVEFTRLLRLTTSTIDPISFKLPRSEKLMQYFQDDVFVPMLSGEPGLPADAWFAGGNKDAPRYDACPAGQKRLSEKPEEEITVTKSTGFLKELEKAEDLEKEKKAVFERFTGMATTREVYHPNLSMGAKGPAAKDAEVDESEWGDDD